MQAASTLELVAEVAVAFAGFSGIVGVYRERAGATSDPGPDLRILVEYSVYLLAAALLPLFLWHGGVSEYHAWRVASFLSALYTATYYLVRHRTLVANTSEKRSVGAKRLDYAFYSLDWLLAALLVVNAAGVLPFDPIVIYLVNLGYQLTGTSLTFVRFVAPLWRAAA